MIVRVKDFCGSIQQIKDHVGLFGDKFGDDLIASATTEEASLDAKTKRFKFIASDDSVDLHGEIVAAGAFHELRQVYLSRPSILTNHMHRLDNGFSAVIGKTIELQTERNPVWGVGQLNNTAAGRDHAEAVFSGSQRGVSVGFRERETDRQQGRLVHTKALLLEISLVAVPANPNSLVLEFVHGKLASHGRLKITDPVQGDEWMAMLKELQEQIVRLQATLAPRAQTALETFGDGGDPNAGSLSDDAYEQREIDECLGGPPALADDEFTDAPDGDDFSAALVDAVGQLSM